MKSQFINTNHIEGYLYEHDLKMKVTGPNSKHPGTQFISGTVSIATDDECTNIVPIHYTYVTEKTAKNKTNATFTTLNDIIEDKYGTVMNRGKENAAMVRADTAVGLNEFYSNRTGKMELVSVRQNEGGFIHVVDSISDDEKVRNKFICDMLITSVAHIDADEERNLPEKAIVRGAIFDYRKSLLPIEFSAVNPNAIGYFEGLEASKKNPVFTKLWGRQVSEVIIKRETEESAFGEASIRETKSTRKDFVITGASKVTYVWDDESSLTAVELNEMVTERETYLATLKQRQEDYQASKNAGTATSAIPAKDGFNF